jgi:hypothetical protein
MRLFATVETGRWGHSYSLADSVPARNSDEMNVLHPAEIHFMLQDCGWTFGLLARGTARNETQLSAPVS